MWMAEFRSAAMCLVEIPGTEDRAASSAGLVAICDASAAMAALLLRACQSTTSAIYHPEFETYNTRYGQQRNDIGRKLSGIVAAARSLPRDRGDCRHKQQTDSSVRKHVCDSEFGCLNQAAIRD